MANRVSDNLMFNKGQESLVRVRDKMARNQEQALTGKAVNRVSDDPVATMRILDLKSKSDRNEQVSKNLEFAQSFLNLTDASLGELGDVLSRAKELAIQASNSSNQSEEARMGLMNEAEQIFLHVVQIGNTRLGDRYIFGGYQVDRPPFDAGGNYFGDAGNFELETDRGQRIDVNIPGIVPFFGTSEIPNTSEEIRKDSSEDKVPTVEGGLRAPASIVAENRKINPVKDKDEYAEIEKKTGVNVFHVLKSFSEGLHNNNVQQINAALDGIDEAFKQVLTARTITGARQNAVQASVSSLDFQNTNNAQLKSQVEDADTLKVYSDITRNQNLLNASLEINRKILTPSLLDFLK
jgi:flagellar hook-associated protein 3 FlgL